MFLVCYVDFQDDAVKQLRMLQKEIQESTEELNRIKPLYDNQLKKEENITKGYVCKNLMIVANNGELSFINMPKISRCRVYMCSSMF